jgi:hypothetical protein
MKRVILIGTDHEIQKGQRGIKLKNCFEKYLLGLVKKYDINSVAEEIDEGAECIVAKKICESRSIIHKIIEPHPSEYDELEIEHVHKIDYYFSNNYDLESTPPNESNCSPQVLQEYRLRVQGTHRRREKEWLQRILNLNIWPVLIICGSSHFEPFSELLLQNDIEITFSESNWKG